MIKRNLDVVSVCNALVDILVEVDMETLHDLQLEKGIMHLVDREQKQSILSRFKDNHRTSELGGSALNVIRSLTSLGRRTFFAGMIAEDSFGRQIEERLRSLGVNMYLSKRKKSATGTCLVLVTPDHDRTMVTYLGASKLYDESLVPHDAISHAKIFHFTGYQWDTKEQKKAIYAAIKTAKQSGTLVSFDVADPFVVERHRREFVDIIRFYADIVFANDHESELLYQTPNPEEVAGKIAQHGAIAVIKLGEDGAFLQKEKETHHVKAISTKVVDTTAAGDMFAAGFLHGLLLEELALDQIGHIASKLASDVISRIGATVSEHCFKKIIDNYS